jgi:hypothetical protein
VEVQLHTFLTLALDVGEWSPSSTGKRIGAESVSLACRQSKCDSSVIAATSLITTQTTFSLLNVLGRQIISICVQSVTLSARYYKCNCKRSCRTGIHVFGPHKGGMSPRRYPYFDVVVGFVWSHDPKSYADGSVCYW